MPCCGLRPGLSLDYCPDVLCPTVLTLRALGHLFVIILKSLGQLFVLVSYCKPLDTTQQSLQGHIWDQEVPQNCLMFLSGFYNHT